MQLMREYTFEAAHHLPSVPADHKCSRIHGHSYRIVVYVEGEVNADTGMVIDFAEIDATVTPLVIAHLDHRYLNDLADLKNPTAENLARWIWTRVRPEMPMLKAIEVRETPTCAVLYDGRDEPARPRPA